MDEYSGSIFPTVMPSDDGASGLAWARPEAVPADIDAIIRDGHRAFRRDSHVLDHRIDLDDRDMKPRLRYWQQGGLRKNF